eukprot:5222212-Lingulodinium_polyedra.AAC.1
MTEQTVLMEEEAPTATDLEVDDAGPLAQQESMNAPPPPPVEAGNGGLCPICQHGLDNRPVYRWPRCRHPLHQDCYAAMRRSDI